MAAKTMMFKMADRDTRSVGVGKKVNGVPMHLLATQNSLRTKRAGKTKYIYRFGDTMEMYYNRARDGIMFYPLGYDVKSMALYYDVFVRPPLTPAEQQWMARYGYKFVTS